MRTKLLIAGLVLIWICANATQAVAQSGTVGWVGVAGACELDSGSAGHKTVFGTVSFSGTSSGNIKLNCWIDGITRMNPSDVNAWGLIFKNDNGFVGGTNLCTVTGQFVSVPNNKSVPSTVIGSFSTAGHSYSGWTTADPLPLSQFLNMDSNTYGVSITLHRNTNATCNPQVWVTFAENIIF